jgi:hypothetical protein
MMLFSLPSLPACLFADKKQKGQTLSLSSLPSSHSKILLLQLLRRLLTGLGKSRLIPVKVIHLLLVRIVMAEESVEDDRSTRSEDGDARVHPKNLGVDENGDEGLVESGAESVGEEVDTLDEGLHRGRGFGVGVLEAGDGNEDLGQADEDVCGRLHGNVQIVWEGTIPVHAGRACAWRVVARSGRVDEVLHDGGVSHAYRGEAEANCDAHDGAQLDASLAENRVNDAVEEGCEDQDGDRVEVLHEVVRHAVALHLSGLRDKVGRELTVANPEDGD